MATKQAVEYSSAAVASIDVSTLSNSRFIDGAARRLPFRDELGRVNLHLVQASLALLEVEEGAGDEAMRLKLGAWLRHARRSIDTRPDDERMPLSALLPSNVLAPAVRGKGVPTPLPETLSSTGSVGSEDPEAPNTITMPKRLFRAPRPGDEPRLSDLDGSGDDDDGFDSDVPVDVAHLSRIGALNARGAVRGKRKRGSAGGTTPTSARKHVKSSPARAAARAHPSLALDDDDDVWARPEEEKEEGEEGETASSGGGSSVNSSGGDDGVYEVEALLAEDETGAGRGFLIRWAGWGPEHDSWEPEANVAPQLVSDFRHERGLARSNRGDDYLVGRTRMLWCDACVCHLPADSFSANQRRSAPERRTCLNHHYKSSRSPHVSSSHVQVTPVRATAHASVRGSGGRATGGLAQARVDTRSVNRSDCSDCDDGDAGAPAPRSRVPPPPPRKPSRPVARALSHRQAALEVQACRLFGFGFS
jgi:hypothetical protein